MNADGDRHLRVPVGHDAHRWRTFHAEKTLVVAARTVTSTVRVLETLPALIRGDSRISTVFAHDPTSAFSNGVPELLRDAGCRVMPWSQLGAISPDLIVSASENIDVPDGPCPVLVLPHGIGFQKSVPDSRTPHSRLSGVVPDRLLESGRAWLAVSHPDQEEQLLAAHPKAAGRTLLVGDPCYDELAASVPYAADHKRALGIADDQCLVVLSSTWGPTSLLGQDPELPARLLSHLPYDEYRVAAILHPNVWAAHGSWQIRTVQAAALEAGLLLMPPVHAWRTALTAAGVVVGDHGSVTLYGAATGKPVLLGAFGEDAVAGTAIDRLGEAAPRLDPAADLREQIDSAVRLHTPERCSRIADLAFAEPGRAVPRLRAALYDLLELPEPQSGPPPRPRLPVTGAAPPAVTSWTVTTTATVSAEGQAEISVRRLPAAVAYGIDEENGTYVHLSCDEEERDRRLTESASVVTCSRPAASTVAALTWIRETLNRLPGSFLAGVALSGHGCLIGVRDGRVVEATVTGTAVDPGLPAAVVHTCLRARLPLDETFMTLRTGGTRQEDIALRLRPHRLDCLRS